MGAVFISYAHEDRPAAKRVAELLAGHGHSVFWDRQILPGTTWDELIERELNQAQCAIVLWSSHSVTSKWVKAEAGEAAERSVLLPVLIEPAELPLRFKSIHTANLVGWDGDEQNAEWQNLLEAVRRLGEGKSIPKTTEPVRSGVLTPSPRTSRRSLLRWLALAVVVVGTLAGVYTAYQSAARKGRFSSKLSYFTLVHSSEGMAVGDSVTIDGTPVGEIVQIELNPLETAYNVAVIFTIRDPYGGYVWTDSRARVRWNASKQKRLLEVLRGSEGIPTYVSWKLTELPAKEALASLQSGKADLGQDVFEGTNLVASALRKVPGTALSLETLQRLKLERLTVLYRNQSAKKPTGVWDEKSGRYVPVDQLRSGYFLRVDEAPAAEP